MSTQNFKDISAAIQSMVVSIGLIIAAGWAAYEFTANRYDSLDLNIDAKQIAVQDDKYVVSIKLHAKNDGNEELRVPLNEHSIVLSLADFLDSGVLKKSDYQVRSSLYSFAFPRLEQGTAAPSGSITVQPGADKTFQYLVKVSKPGLYLVEFISPAESELFYWGAQTYVYIN